MERLDQDEPMSIAGVSAAQTTVKQHYITPSDVALPEYQSKRSARIHQPVAVHQMPSAVIPAQADSSQYEENQTLKSELDGFMLLEETGMGFPEDAQQAILVDKKLKSVVPDDLMYFTQMLFVDVSENKLPLFPFGALPNLRELRIACNGISEFGELLGFQNLLYLDLSYNKLRISSMQGLEVLPNLKELDLSGNNMGGIPEDLRGFQALEKLILDYNKLEESEVFYALSTANNLRHVSLANNFLSSIPSNAGDHDAFMRLELLDLSFNYFGNEEAVEPAVILPRISVLVLYGNPLLGPTGEDSMYVYIEDMVERAAEFRENSGSSLPDIDFVTEIPRRRVLKKGQPMGRQATYRDFSIVQVEQVNVGTNREWRQRGMQTIFAETMAYKKQLQQKQQLQSSASNAGLPTDFTFITNSAGLANSNPAAVVNSAQSIASVGTGGLGVSAGIGGGGTGGVDVIADDVMKRVAEELGLVNSAELLKLKDKATLPPSAISILDQSLEENSASQFADPGGNGPFGTLATLNVLEGGATASSSTLHQPQVQLSFPAPVPYTKASTAAVGGVKEQLPDSLFNKTMGDSQQLVAHPIALKTAMKALRTALRQPLTSYNELPAHSSQEPVKEVHRSTRSSRMRQMPRHTSAQSSHVPMVAKEAAGADGTEDFLDKRTHKYNRRGMREAKELAEARQQNRDRTLSQIDEVLHGLNENTSIWSERQHKIHHHHKSEREQMNEMRNFAQPYSGIKGLVEMVEEVNQEFNS